MVGIERRRETVDGARPETGHLDPKVAARHPLPAFALLHGGDLFDPSRPRGCGDLERANEVAARALRFRAAGDVGPSEPSGARRVRADVARQLGKNPTLAARMAAAKPVRVDLVGSTREMIRLGYPSSVAKDAAGLFWDAPRWDAARIALRTDRLDDPAERTLVFHEYAHAIHHLGFTAEERKLIEGVLRPVFSHPADQDEVFAIYSEREMLGAEAFSSLERAAPGIYGICRRQWDENHVFAAFVKKLYDPGARVRAGDGARAAAERWRKFSGG